MGMTHRKRKPGHKPLPRITEAEWVVMRILWRHAPFTTNQVVEALDAKTDWKPKTIHTLLSRLVQKGALEFERRGREYLFRPLVSEEECQQDVSRSFLGSFFGGELAPFLARFVESEKLDARQIEELKRILEGKSQ